ncbi:MAG: M48 family metallopeptidase [Candidatus Limnocylindrus sp.]
MSLRPYTLIRSPRARRLSLRIDPEIGLEAVVPERFGEARARREVEAFIATRLAWVDRSLAQIARRRAALGTNGRVEVGGVIPYAGRAHRIVVAPSTHHGGIAIANGKILIPEVIARDPDRVRTRLNGWLRRRARAVAEQMINVYAQEMRVKPHRIRIGDQSTRWGSASPDGTISLSWRLVLAPPSCFEAVIVHELAHLRSRGHGPPFRAVVERHCPDELVRMRLLQRLAPALGAVR